MKHNKPFRTPKGPKKFAVYVKDEQGKSKKVTFGDPKAEIKRDDPKRRKAFRDRHNCDDPGPKTKARYWSCKMWGKKPVSKITSEAKAKEPAAWVADEDLWARAKKAASKAGAGDLYALTTYIYKRMGGAIKGQKEAASVSTHAAVTRAKEDDKTGVRTTHWFWATDVFLKGKKKEEEKPAPVIAAPSAADEQAQALLIDSPGISGATLLNSLKAKGIKLVDEKQTIEAGDSRKLSMSEAAFFSESAQNTQPGIGPVKFRVALIQEGLGNLRDGFFYSKEAINSGVTAFEGRKCYADHPARSEESDRPERSVRDIIGHFENLAVEENDDGSARLMGNLVMPPDPPFEWARALVRESIQYSEKYPEQNLVGLSINANGDADDMSFEEFEKSYKIPESCKPKLLKAKAEGLQSVRYVSAIRDAVSCDLVTEPGARGKIISIIESEKEIAEMKRKIRETEEKKELPTKAEEEETEAKKAVKAGEKKEADDAEDHEDIEKDKKLILDMIKKHMGDDEELEAEGEEAAIEAYEAYKELGESEDEAMKCAAKSLKLAKHMAAKHAEKAHEADEAKKEAEEKKEDEAKKETKKESEVIRLEGRVAFLEKELKKRELADLLDSKLKESGLGRAETDKIRKIIGEPKSETEITKTITIFKEAFLSRSESAKGSDFFVMNTEKQSTPAKSKAKINFNECT